MNSHSEKILKAIVDCSVLGVLVAIANRPVLIVIAYYVGYIAATYFLSRNPDAEEREDDSASR